VALQHKLELVELDTVIAAAEQQLFMRLAAVVVQEVLVLLVLAVLELVSVVMVALV
jgi:hypothetical protein